MKFLFSLAVGLLSTTVASAADLAPASPEPVAPIAAYSWTGFYVGAQAGYSWARDKQDLSSEFTGIPQLSPMTAHSSGSPKGFFGGGYVGYNHDFGGNFVLGVEGDINASSLRSKNEGGQWTGKVAAAGLGQLARPNAGFEQDWFGSVRLRAGYAFDRFLPYVTGGFAFGDYKDSFKSIVLSAPAFDDGAGAATGSKTVYGWTVGAGLEYAITDNIIGRLEYRYTDYGKATVDVVDGIGHPGTMKTSLKTNDVRVGVSYKF